MDSVQAFNTFMEKPDSNGYIIEKGSINDIDQLENLYDNLNDYLAQGINYPGWAKGIYPVRETAVNGIESNSLFILKIDNEIAGSVILNHKPEIAYSQITWGIEADYNDIIVIHTLTVHPKYMEKGVARRLMDFAKSYSMEQKMKAIRLDVSIHNAPAISLYEKCGYRYVGTVDLGLNIPELVWFKLYEIVL
ncbi:putative acetyltransferase [Oxobacter pfennigii]|uniref:Putative acetyltransferase n=1 Tax=Oxobacter pfennigii TaxID=36849 RepID=A0A0P8WD98_9CLOT|nr:GNAT family N-acetyltransferase [Oxobacter pfennigii]KPU45863.1 putative acetyltransferase [Oxobacter pfennigii]